MTNQNETLNRIATVADGLSRGMYTKKAAFATVRKLITSPHEIDDHDMAVLYRHFSPPAPKKPKTAYDWLVLAMAKDDVRYYLKYVYSDGARLMATDGHRLHITDNYLDLEPGFYDKNQNKIDVTATYPNVDRIIPDQYESSATIGEFTIGAYEYEGKNTDVYVIHDISVDKQYMDAALTGFDNPLIYYKDKSRALYIREQNKTAVIMPIRRK